jgi:hypothetical protein
MLCYLYHNVAYKQTVKKYEAVAKVRLCRKPEYEINKTVLVTEYIYISVYRTSRARFFPISYTQHAGRKTWRSSSEVSVSASVCSKLDNVDKLE